MSDRERSRSPSASERKVIISGDQSPPHGRPRDREKHDSPGRNNKIVKRSYSRSPSGGRSRKMSYRGDRGREERDRGEKDRDRGDRRYRSRSRSRSPKRYKSRYSHSRSRSHSRGRHVGTRDNPTPCRCLGVFGLSVNTTESEIEYIFAKYGPVERVQVVIDAKTGQSRGFCFVYFESTEDAKAAKDGCNGIKVGGKNIRVDFSITQRAHTPTPGIYMGKPTYMSSRMGWNDRGRGGRDRDDYYGYRGSSYRDRRSQSPPYYRRRRYNRSRSRSYSPRRY